jgi:DNA-binding Lrp family transcriptional regulator
MDLKDKRIIEELMLNSRIPINQLSKKVGVSREVCIYRIKKLKQKIITGFITNINPEALGYQRYECFIQLKGISSTKEKELIKKIENHNLTTYLSAVIGRWNIVFDIFIKNPEELEDLMQEITSEFSQYLENYVFLRVGIQEGVFPTKLIGANKQIKSNLLAKEIKIDELDKKILALLSNNSRIEYKELSKKLNLTANAIKYRIKNLERTGVIRGYTISINIKEIGYDLYNLQLKLETIKRQELLIFLKHHSNVFYYYKYLGHENWDLDIGILIKDSLELRKFILELRERFGDIIKIYDFYMIVEPRKMFLPKGIFK